MKVRDRVRELRVPDDSGRLVPLVLSERVLFQAQRTPELETPPLLALPLGLIGLLLGGGLAVLARRQSRAAVPLAAIVAFVLGAIGVALLYLRFMTQHVAAYDNTNLYTYNPVWLLVAATVWFVGRSAAARRLVYLLATIAGGLTAFGIIAPFVPGFTQGSFAVVILAAPAGLVAAWIVRERSRPAPVPAT